jgi:hypothetical protein
MNKSAVLPKLDHVVWKYHLYSKKHHSTGKRFFPGGRRVFLHIFQNCFRTESGKISFALALIRDYGLADKVMMGKKPLLMDRPLAEYLYDKAIHPSFFAAALQLIGSKAKELAETAQRIQLRNLSRDSISEALNRGTVKEAEIGRDFFAFSQQTPDKKLAILAALGVITYVDIAPAQEPRPVVLEPRPPITPAKNDKNLELDPKGQYSLPGVR